ncbi:MAG: hypothetical protein M3N47_00770 [Chloroflexota bacterium]|nr:hypothetical protein [Chloroflexota bacterium]
MAGEHVVEAVDGTRLVVEGSATHGWGVRLTVGDGPAVELRAAEVQGLQAALASALGGQ